MEKIKSNLPLGILLDYVVKVLTVGPTSQDAYIIKALVGLASFFKYYESLNRIKVFEDKVKDLEDKHNKISVEFREIQTALQATKLIQSVKVFPGIKDGGR